MRTYKLENGGTEDPPAQVLVLTASGLVTYEIKHDHGPHEDRCNACHVLRGGISEMGFPGGAK